MKLSDAIIEGAALLPQTTKEFQRRDNQGTVYAACAIGAACYVAAPDRYVSDFSDARKIFPQLSDVVEVQLPDLGKYAGHLEAIIMHYNDALELSFEEIAHLVRMLNY
jgi:peptidase E